MVTGVEAAGLVLGAIPLLVAALEHYEGSLEPTVAFLRWKGELSTGIRKLYLGCATYDQTMRLLLKPITNMEKLAEMMDNPRSCLWKDGVLTSKLQEKLGPAYRPCIMTIEDIKKIMINLAKNLNIDGASEVTQRGLEAIVLANHPVSDTPIWGKKFEFRKRVKFTMKRREVKILLQELEMCNDRLYAFTEKAEKLEAEPYRVRKNLKFSAPLHCIQENAKKLHEALSRSWCSSHTSHCASLHLEQRLVRQKAPRKKRLKRAAETVAEANCFGLCLLRSSLEPKWLDTEFRLAGDVESPSKRDVRFVVSAPEGTFSCLPYDDPLLLQEISDICSILQQPSHSCVGFCFDDLGKLRGVYPAQRRVPRCAEKTTTLGDLLATIHGKLAIEDKYTLAITLTSSLLQLSQTPWLIKPWSKKDIVFLRAGENASISVDITQPYLMQTYSDKHPTTAGDIPSRDDGMNLLALAIMLLEINFAQPIEDLRRPEDLVLNGPPNELTDLSTARRWLMEQENGGNLSCAFSSAITYCLQCYVNPCASFLDPEFRRAVEEQVLERLEEEMQYLLFGPSAQ